MEDKKSFGKYIADKRIKKGLTQEELAKKLYVIPTTVSKWERGITYPDISIIMDLCKELGISEHELFTACDDLTRNKEKKELEMYYNLKKYSLMFINIGYIIALITCFICNLVIDHTLSWFLIVLVSIGISYSITSLPKYIENNRYKFSKIALIVTILIYLLLIIINIVIEENILKDALIIASYVFLILWSGIIIATFTNIKVKYKVAINIFLIALLTSTTNPFVEKVTKINSEGNNIYNLAISIILLIIAIAILFKNEKKS